MKLIYRRQSPHNEMLGERDDVPPKPKVLRLWNG